MAETTNISWTDSTVSFWWGCTKVGPGCDHCYAEELSDRFTPGHWGSGAPRRKIKSAVKTLQRLDNDYSNWAADAECARGNAKAFGRPVPAIANRRRVFVQSMSDFFDNEVPNEWRNEAWDVMTRCDRVDIQLLTKRISNVEKMIKGPWPKHIGLMVTVVNQDEADRDIPRLLKAKAAYGIPWVGISYEPALGALHIAEYMRPIRVYEGGFTDDLDAPRLDWVIAGGESGGKRRPCEIEWFESLYWQTRDAEVAMFIKQDVGPRPGMQGRIPDWLWKIKEFPK